MMTRFTRMLRDGDDNMMERIEKLMVQRENLAEENINKQISKAEVKITENITLVIKDEDKKLENHLNTQHNNDMMSMKDDLNQTVSNTARRLDTKFTTLETTYKESMTEIGLKLSVITKKEEIHHSELVDGLAQLEELKNKVNSTNRRMEDLSITVTDELGRYTATFDRKLEDVRTTLENTSVTIDKIQVSVRQVEANTAQIHEVQSAMTSMQSRLCTLEAEKLSTAERFALQRARIDRIESSIRDNDIPNMVLRQNTEYVSRMELSDRALNLLGAGLPPDMQTVGGLIAFAFKRLQLNMTPADIINVFKIGDTQRGPLVKIRFGSMAARTAFYKARTKLGPTTTIWFSEDLTRANEILAYQARRLAFHQHLARTWTYLGQVFIQRTANGEPEKVYRKEDLPNFEILNEITTPLATPARFRAVQNQAIVSTAATVNTTAEPVAGTSTMTTDRDNNTATTSSKDTSNVANETNTNITESAEPSCSTNETSMDTTPKSGPSEMSPTSSMTSVVQSPGESSARN